MSVCLIHQTYLILDIFSGNICQGNSNIATVQMDRQYNFFFKQNWIAWCCLKITMLFQSLILTVYTHTYFLQLSAGHSTIHDNNLKCSFSCKRPLVNQHFFQVTSDQIDFTGKVRDLTHCFCLYFPHKIISYWHHANTDLPN